MAYNRGDLVQCTCGNGKHTGRVVAVLGAEYGVFWESRNPEFGKPSNTAPQYPADFVKAHARHLMTAGEKDLAPRA